MRNKKRALEQSSMDPFEEVAAMASAMPVNTARATVLQAAVQSVSKYLADYGCESLDTDCTLQDVIDKANSKERDGWFVMDRVMGRTQVQALLVNLVAEGEYLPALCKVDGMPRLVTVMGWLDDYPDFAVAMKQAERAQAMLFMYEAMAIADGTTPKDSFVAKLRMDMRGKMAQLLDSRKWSPKQIVEVTVREEASAESLRSRLMAIMLSNAKRYREEMGLLVLRQEDLPRLVLSMAESLKAQGIEVMKTAGYVDSTLDVKMLAMDKD